MNYYYDISLNFKRDNLSFYEWNKNDKVVHLTKVLIYQVNSSQFMDLLNYNVVLENKSLEDFKDKIVLFASVNGVIALKFNKLGKSVLRSFLPLEEEIEILDNLYDIKLINLEYEKKKKIKENNVLRQDIKIKNFIKEKIANMVSNNEYSKLKYIYYEWFNKELENMSDLKEIDMVLDREIGIKEKKIYDLIKLSYNNV